ncbi:MAG: hypothetical protein HY787_07050 [Deltaproteobacteria bacterium]|nr:hypothetical protein [Deltaproteobacteria bacterium]
MILSESEALTFLAGVGLRAAKPVLFDSVELPEDRAETIAFPVMIKTTGAAALESGRHGFLSYAGDAGDLRRKLERMTGGTTPASRTCQRILENCIADGWVFSIDFFVDNARGLSIMTIGPSSFSIAESGVQSLSRQVEFVRDPLQPLRRYQALAMAKKAAVPAVGLRQVSDLIVQLDTLFFAKDCLRMTIDPISLGSDGKISIAGCWLELDDDGLFRHPDIQMKGTASGEPLEAKARAQGITYVELGGDIAILSAGAGATMGLVDMVHHFGGRPANFIDTMGGASIETIRNLANLVLDKAGTDPSIKVILMVMHLSATPLQPVVETFVQTITTRPPRQPIVGFLQAGGGALLNYSLTEAHSSLRKCGVQVESDLSLAIEKAVRLSGREGKRAVRTDPEIISSS